VTFTCQSRETEEEERAWKRTGRQARDLPVEPPKKFEMVINLRTAKALGIIIPPSMLARVDSLID